MALNVEPTDSVFSVSGGNNTHKICNTTDKRHAFKVKSSNNTYYRVNVVYGFAAASEKVDLIINRLPGGPAGRDRFVVQWAEVPDDETDPKAPFVAMAQSGEVVFHVEAKEEPAN